VGLHDFSSCKNCVDVLQSYLDGEMAPEDEAHLRSHLAECPPCVDFLETYKATPELCRKALAQRMPEELSQKLKAFLREKAGRS